MKAPVPGSGVQDTEMCIVCARNAMKSKRPFRGSGNNDWSLFIMVDFLSIWTDHLILVYESASCNVKRLNA